MQTAPRDGAVIDRIYVHTNEGPQYPNAAPDLAGYLEHADGGYQIIVDDQHTVVAASDDLILWSEGGDNTHCVAICFIGFAHFTPADWATPYSVAMLERGAQAVAAWCRKYNVPPTWVAAGAPGQPPTGRGLAEHADDHDPHSDGHTDPGFGFPKQAFAARVVAILAPPINWKIVERLGQWKTTVSADPLVFGATGPDVSIMNDLLANHGFPLAKGNAYGQHSADALLVFKTFKKLANRNGKVCGADCAAALLKP